MCLDNKKILVTGGLGFIGRSLLEKLIETQCGAKLYAIDIKDIPENAKILKENIIYEQIDIRDENSIKCYILNHKFDGVIHLAAVSRVIDSEKDKRNCIETNYKGTKYIAEAVRKLKNCWMIFGSSREVYGEQNNLPVCEKAELLPINVYGFYKLEGERIVQSLVKRNCILRFCNVYGNEYDIKSRVIPTFVSTAMKGGVISLEGGDQIIDFTHIDNTVTTIIKCINKITKSEIKSDTIHISPGISNKITDIIDILKQLGYQFKVKINEPRSYDVHHFVGDKTKRIMIFGDEKFIDLKEGIEKLIEIYKKTDKDLLL